MENLLKLAQTCFLYVSLKLISNNLSKFKISSFCDLRLQSYWILQKFICTNVWQHFYLAFWFDLRSYHKDVHFLKISSLYDFWFQIYWYITIFCWPMVLPLQKYLYIVLCLFVIHCWIIFWWLNFYFWKLAFWCFCFFGFC